MAEVPFAKGYYGVDYRTLLGLQRNVGGASSASMPGDPAWDVWVGPLPFLLASSPERAYLRETAPVRRERFDSARDPGENSLDSGLWIRSWTSWHLGAGQDSAEPLETDPEVARFRFDRSAGVDIFDAGSIQLLNACSQRRTGVRRLTAHPGYGVVASTDADGVRLIDDVSDTQLATDTVTSITVGLGRWYGITDAGTVVWGPLTGGPSSPIASITGATTVQVAKDRLWVGAGASLYEVTDVGAATQSPFHSFTDGSIIDIDTGAGGLYVMVDQGLTYVYVIAANNDGTLSPPEEVAVLPRGETGTMMYGYLSRYLALGTSRGVRMADCSTTESLTVGPLVIEIEGGCVDATADSNFLWVTGGTEKVDVTGDGSDMRAGLYRLDLSRQVAGVAVYGDNAAGRYSYTTDLYAPSGVAARASSVTTFEGRIYWSDSSGTLFMQDLDAYVPSGYLETGWVNFSTAETKAWQSVFAEATGEGFIGVDADSGAGFSAVVQSALRVPISGDANFDTVVHPPSTRMRLRVILIGDGTGTPRLESASMRAMPAPKRSRYVRIPLLAYDHQVDRNNSPVGYEGFTYDRLKDLEELEERGGIVQVLDTRSGETLTCQIDRVTFSSDTPPDRGYVNYGGIVTLTLLSV